jgi:hypothetical protein
VGKRVKWETLVDNVWTRPIKRGFKEQCCSCGHTHIVDFRIVDGHVEFRARTDHRATAAARRAFKFTPDEE